MKIKDLQALCDTQLSQIFELRQTIQSQTEEIKHLKDLLYNATPVISTDTSISDEEFIAINELKKLKGKSEQQELTFEDAKRVELYFKVIKAIRAPKEKQDDGQIKEFSTEDLLSEISSKEE